MATVTLRSTDTEHVVDYDSDNDNEGGSDGRLVVTKCGITARSWWENRKFTSLRKPAQGDRKCEKCWPLAERLEAVRLEFAESGERVDKMIDEAMGQNGDDDETLPTE